MAIARILPTLNATVLQWQARAADLARWTWQRLVNRTDVWGGYNALADRDKIITSADGNTTKLEREPTARPAVAKRGQVLLTPAVLERHFGATGPEHVVGLHTTAANNTSRWGAIEVDWHGETSSPAEINLATALSWYGQLRGLGFRPLLTDSNGSGGYHLTTVFSGPVQTQRVFAFMRWLIRDHATLGLPKPPETFPKQPRIAPGKCGNWLRVPGRHHTREHWSRVWDGNRWLDGAAAVELILAVTGDNPEQIPFATAAVAARPACSVLSSSRTDPAEPGAAASRIRAYLDKLPIGLGEGQHRDDYLFCFAAWLVRDMALLDVEALTWMAEWDARQAAAKGAVRLREILENAKRYGQRAVGCGLGAPAAPRRARTATFTIPWAAQL